MDFATLLPQNFFFSLVKDFLQQARTGGLETARYKQTIGPLTLKVSFGQGAMAKVPWLDFFGYGQTAQNGIYPACLYYKSDDLLLLAYGVSATQAPEFTWGALTQGKDTVAQYLRRTGLGSHYLKPGGVIYGASYLKQAFPEASRFVRDALYFQRFYTQLLELLDEYTTYMTQNGFATPDTPPATRAVSRPLGAHLTKTPTRRTLSEASAVQGAQGTRAASTTSGTPGGKPYSIDTIIADGAFVSHDKLSTMLDRLRATKNIILQGPPGTGKTWLAKRLAYALMGRKNADNLLSVQFHPNMSYEDFIRGWRPTGNGTLSLQDGPFLAMRDKAFHDPASPYVVIIEEINRGNPAQIFGEMLTLMEGGKRTPDDALYLSYRKPDEPPCYLPENLYIIGTMNIADRSLALVDLALRRRFAFIDLEPCFNEPWRARMRQAHIPDELTDSIQAKMIELNKSIAANSGLGKQCRVGHSYVTPPRDTVINDSKAWFVQIVETQIGPLLEEYAQDATFDAQQACEALLRGC